MIQIQKYLGYIVLGVIIIVLSFGGGYLYGSTRQKVVQANQEVKQVKVDSKTTADLNGIKDKSDASAAADLPKIITRYVYIKKDVANYATKNSNASDVLDSEWVRNFNASTENPFAGNPVTSSVNSSEPATTVAKLTATKAEALDASIENNKNYFICKQGFDSLFSFYNEIKNKVNTSQ